MCKPLHLLAELDILVLRTTAPGRSVMGGDIDNRLNTLFDGQDPAAALQEAVQKLWQAAVSQHRDRFVVTSFTHAATLVSSEVEGAPTFTRRVTGATAQIHSTEQVLITAILVVEVLAG